MVQLVTNGFGIMTCVLQKVLQPLAQLSIRWIEKSLNLYLNKLLKTEGEDYVIASDTDSVYITFDRLVDKVFKKRTDESEDNYRGRIVDFLDTVAKEKIEPFIDKSYQGSCFVCKCI